MDIARTRFAPTRQGLGPLIIAAVAIAGCTGNVGSQGSESEPGQASVHRVIDGDTIEVVIDDQIHLVRLLGIDTPETVHPTKPEQCYGRQASDALSRALPVGSVVQLTKDQQARDHFDRLLLYVHRDDGLFINQWLVEEGLADAVFYEPNTHHRTAFSRAANRATAEAIGLWGACEGPDQPLP